MDELKKESMLLDQEKAVENTPSTIRNYVSRLIAAIRNKPYPNNFACGTAAITSLVNIAELKNRDLARKSNVIKKTSANAVEKVNQ